MKTKNITILRFSFILSDFTKELFWRGKVYIMEGEVKLCKR